MEMAEVERGRIVHELKGEKCGSVQKGEKRDSEWDGATGVGQIGIWEGFWSVRPQEN